ncbi:unnamed protein product [Didymodactylos carnosus]|uniref:Protein kinase domain-containing protein n=1 Tax=Didymodactylos carnosus TaxID=1234261 RepID=A0A814FY94_9BILA|nr:unnamed protein product [Didymodactylos carnosus]CAF1012825.1 unnamed protein product [Didymodactylos carnosus]CAF3763639.1 unnamed protein product [Didymodactylos carnosus]CAF3781757.1 unnamed protein product [Didymodactylos carnosus]
MNDGYSKYKIDGVIVEDSLVGVYRAYDRTTNEVVALKKIKIGRHGEYELWAKPAAENEIAMLKKLNHSNVIKLLHSFQTNDSEIAVLVLEFMEADLARLIACHDNHFSHSDIKSFSQMILKGIEYIHEAEIIHQDIKPANILINEYGIVKLADFGISIHSNDQCRKMHRLPAAWYRSPELLLGDKHYTEKIDIWSAGVVIAELINRQILFPSKNEIEQIYLIYKMLGQPDDETWPEAKTLKHFLQFHDDTIQKKGQDFCVTFPTANLDEIILLKSMLTMNPRNRSSAKELLNSIYFVKEPLPTNPQNLPRLAVTRRRHTRHPFNMTETNFEQQQQAEQQQQRENDHLDYELNEQFTELLCIERRLFQRLIQSNEQQLRFRSRLPFNTVVLFVPQQEAWVVERMGKFYKTLEPGLNIILPIIDSIRYVQSLKEIAIEIPSQTAISKDNVTLNIDGVLYLKVFEPYLASYGVEDAEFAVTQLAQTTMRSEIGKITLDTLFRERELLNVGIVEAINKAAKAWGIVCLRYEIRDIRLPPKVQEAMQMQVEAERRKRASILESEGIRESQINKAEGTKQAVILASEAVKLEQINSAVGEAEAIKTRANARAQALKTISDQLETEEGRNAASLQIAEQYVHAFGNLARTNNTILLPANTGDMSSMIASALAIYNNLHSKDRQGFLTHTNDRTELSATPAIDVSSKQQQHSTTDLSSSLPSMSAAPSSSSSSTATSAQLATLEDTVSIAPCFFNQELSHIVSDEIDKKLANTVYQELGLCICLYDILSIGDCILLPGDANFHTKVKFRYVVFRPNIDEILVGKIRSSSKDGISVTLGFFDDILIPSTKLQHPSRFTEAEQLWAWEYTNEDEKHNMFMDIGEEIRFRVVQEIFEDTAPKELPNAGAPTTSSAIDLEQIEKKAPYSIIGSISEQGLGLFAWWTT